MTFVVLLCALVVSQVAETDLEPTGAELSGLTRIIGSDCYWAVSDKGGKALQLKVRHVGTNLQVAVCRELSLEGRSDCEGCAYDPLTQMLWVSDEHDNSVRAFDTASGRERARLDLPEAYRRCRPNFSIEGLSISPDGRELWVANEEPAKGDDGFVRLTRFVRADARSAWQVAAELRYRPDPVAGAKFMGRYAQSGVSALAALGSGRILVLERECSVKGGFLPTCRARLYEATPKAKTLLWEADTGLANYEGLCLGPDLASGDRSLLLVSDAGSGADERMMVLRVRGE